MKPIVSQSEVAHINKMLGFMFKQMALATEIGDEISLMGAKLAGREGMDDNTRAELITYVAALSAAMKELRGAIDGGMGAMRLEI